ncbi:MAG: 1-deoxy-D-xylulose 5-phosphate reductoisomerase [Candidatus Marinimicrobia bacterium]|nr:1-deoxy-D-xylulose 5-phosphate reductoisomerase [Candidatus Neomarinimicrobiota bacterium]
MESPIKLLTILGSTGSIGENALRVVEAHRERFSIVGLSAHSNAERLIEQARRFHPRIVNIGDESKLDEVKSALAPESIQVTAGRIGLLELASRDDATLLLNAIVGVPGMEPTIQAVESGIDVALSNKESLVMAGDLIRRLMEEHSAALNPVDSEHSAIWQCLAGEKLEEVRRIILTASGGPFRNMPKSEFSKITVHDALNHPNWDMGNKITIDSATMMNKGFEVIEAHWLFNLPLQRINILVHPQSIIHSLVEFVDGSIKAQLGVPDMKVPIQYALLYPEHASADWKRLDLTSLGELTFEKPDYDKFRCLELAFTALKHGGTLPVVLNVANDTAVYAFLREQIRFPEIPELVSAAMDAHASIQDPALDDILETERWTKEFLQPKLD